MSTASVPYVDLVAQWEEEKLDLSHYPEEFIEF